MSPGPFSCLPESSLVAELQPRLDSPGDECPGGKPSGLQSHLPFSGPCPAGPSPSGCNAGFSSFRLVVWCMGSWSAPTA